MTTSEDILVAGGAGFIGSNFVHRAVKEYGEVHVLDKLTYAGREENLSGVRDDIQFVEADIRDRNVVEGIYDKVDIAVNFAAESHVDRSIEEGRAFM
ncbi:MAG: GDP-mannose 4,6-dehydratase, partial [Candidatus Nanohaloarchaea archaeon]|nr:GDP-mannose 4,6-dehydratase [Candidatus Nanohaloarchaea archaeon]